MTDTETATQAVKYAIDTWGEFAHEAIAAEVIKALSASPKGDDLVERLRRGEATIPGREVVWVQNMRAFIATDMFRSFPEWREIFAKEFDALLAAASEAASRIQSLKAERDEAFAQVDALSAKVEALAPHGMCGCSYDTPDDLCLHHSPKLIRAEAENASLMREIAELRAQTRC